MPINPKEFNHAKSIWQDIFIHLKNKGFKVYSPSTPLSESDEPYIILKYNGLTHLEGYSSDDELYDVMAYVPAMQYSTLEPFLLKIKLAMKELEPMVLPYGSQSASFYEDGVKMHYVTIQYKNHKFML